MAKVSEYASQYKDESDAAIKEAQVHITKAGIALMSTAHNLGYMFYHLTKIAQIYGRAFHSGLEAAERFDQDDKRGMKHADPGPTRN